MHTCDRFHLPTQRVHDQDCHHMSKSRGSSCSRLRFSKRNPAKNDGTSLIGVTTKGDSNSLDDEDTEFKGEERAAVGCHGSGGFLKGEEMHVLARQVAYGEFRFSVGDDVASSGFGLLRSEP